MPTVPKSAWHFPDISNCTANVCCWGLKRKWRVCVSKSAHDPKRTLVSTHRSTHTHREPWSPSVRLWHQADQALAAKQPSRRQIVRQITDGVDDPKVVLDRMVANGEIAEHQRGDVLFIRRVIVAPIWDMKPDGSARLVGRRNVLVRWKRLRDGESDFGSWVNSD